jgi:hypothetical protein
LNTLDPELAQKQSQLNNELEAANSEYHIKFLEAVGILEDLEQLQQRAGGRQNTRRRPLSSADVIKQYENDLQTSVPSTINEDEARMKALMDEVRHHCGLGYQPTVSIQRYQAYYLESDKGAVEERQKHAAQLDADLSKAIKAMRTTWKKLEKLRADPA